MAHFPTSRRIACVLAYSYVLRAYAGRARGTESWCLRWCWFACKLRQRPWFQLDGARQVDVMLLLRDTQFPQSGSPSRTDAPHPHQHFFSFLCPGLNPLPSWGPVTWRALVITAKLRVILLLVASPQHKLAERESICARKASTKLPCGGGGEAVAEAVERSNPGGPRHAVASVSRKRRWALEVVWALAMSSWPVPGPATSYHTRCGMLSEVPYGSTTVVVVVMLRWCAQPPRAIRDP